jgi:sporulation protein YlmC with PRC-barrel domain
VPGDESRATDGVRRHRLNDLLGAVVVLRDGSEAGHVNDVRLSGAQELQRYVVDGLIVGRRGEGSMLGYDRREVRGTWLVRALVRVANRDVSYVPWAAVRRIDWERSRVEVDRVEPLTDERPLS